MNLVVNKTVHLNYAILESFEAGLQLTGSEVKSLRAKNGSLKEAYIKIAKNGDLVLTNAYIPPYQSGQSHNESYDPYQDRGLLVHKYELEKIRHALKQKGYTLVPVRIFATKRFIKIEIAVVKGKKQYDKREDLKKKAVKRDLEREVKEY